MFLFEFNCNVFCSWVQYIACMTQFSADWKFPLLYPPVNTENTLPEWISAKNLSQFHCAGTLGISDSFPLYFFTFFASFFVTFFVNKVCCLYITQ